MKKLVLVMAFIFLFITYANYRKSQVLSRSQNYQPKPKRVKALSYEQMDARNKASEKKINSPIIHDSITIIDTISTSTVFTDSVVYDSLKIEMINDTLSVLDITDSLRNDQNKTKR